MPSLSEVHQFSQIFFMKYFVYILQCADGTFYTGVTKDLQKRIIRHNRGHGARYTRGRLPVTLVYYEESDNLKSAMSREIRLRNLPRTKKQIIVNRFKVTRKEPAQSKK